MVVGAVKVVVAVATVFVGAFAQSIAVTINAATVAMKMDLLAKNH